jgi:hypothetical protein
MVWAMVLAHLIGDYILQWDSLAMWKSRELKGVLAHSLVVLVVTWLCALPFDPGWWPWVLFLWVTHLGVDGLPLCVERGWGLKRTGETALMRFLLDQALHFSFIMLALLWSGAMVTPPLATGLVAALNDERLLLYLLGYAFLTMPAWVLVEFLVFGLVQGGAPDFSQATNKYVASLERALMTTFVVLGQFALVPLVAVPRLVFEGPRMIEQRHPTIYLAELLASVALAIAIGLGLRQL